MNSVMNPPMTGPESKPMETTELCNPRARPRSFAGNADATSAPVLAWINAPAMPWMTRARISQ